ncbi:LURP-one-related/scramblase family protein [Haloferax namakaokahaiae]|uniref:LURP-one-related/scramblase family protein n=1 Tax=Haloferax namakaokahaiae TaxID=1748331 RepID=A0ABD5ZCV8_9EURY
MVRRANAPTRRAERRAERQDRRARRQGGNREWERYRMTQRLVSIGDDYFVENAVGEQVFVIDGKALRLRKTLKMTDRRTGDEYVIKERVARVMDTMTVRKNGRRAAAVKKAMVTPLRERFTVLVPGGENLKIRGNIVDHEYQFTRGGMPVAAVSKQWFRMRDNYGIEVAPGEDAGVIIACAVALDMMEHPAR